MTEKLVTLEDVLIWHTNLAKHGDTGSLTRWHQGAAEAVKEAIAQTERLTIHATAYENAYRVAYQATYQSHTGHWDATGMRGAGCPECIRAREARENCNAALHEGLEKLVARAAALPHPPVEPARDCSKCDLGAEQMRRMYARGGLMRTDGFVSVVAAIPKEKP